MSNTHAAILDDVWLGESAAGGLSKWLSPLLVGLIAPVVAGMFIAPDLLRESFGIVALLLGLALLIALGGYIISVLFPGDPAALAIRPQSGSVAVVMKGVLAQREIIVPFKEVAKLSSAKSFDHDGYELSAVELKTKDGDSWVIPCDADETKLAHLRSVIGMRPRTR
jgi:hypothetical protein